MAAIDTSPIPRQGEALKLANSIKSYKNVALAKALVSFDAGGTATGSDVVGIWARSIEFYNDAAAIVQAQTQEQLRQSWLLVLGVDVPTLRNDLAALGAQVVALLDLIENNQAVFLTPSMDRAAESLTYPLLTGGQRAAVKSQLDAIAELII